MLTRIGRTFGLLLAAGATLTLLLPALHQAEASPVAYDFSVTATSGPLAGTTATGMFSYDTSSIVPGGFNLATGLLTLVHFTWDGITYDQTTANTGSMHFDATGTLNGELFGNNCFAGGCNVFAGAVDQWSVGLGQFEYTVAGGFTLGRGTETQSLAAAVPEPSSLALFGAAVAGLLGFRVPRRRKLVNATGTRSRGDQA